MRGETRLKHGGRGHVLPGHMGCFEAGLRSAAGLGGRCPDVGPRLELRCDVWRLDNQQVESLNSSVRINLQSAPNISLPLLSSRIMVRRHFADLRRAGQSPAEILEALQQSHADSIDFRRAGGQAARFTGPAVETLQTMPPRRQGQKGQATGSSASAAATHVGLTQLCPEITKPTVAFALGFSGGSHGGSEGSTDLPPLLCVWICCLRRYSQLYCAQASPEHGLVRPFRLEKLLTVLEKEAGRSHVRPHSGQTGHCSLLVVGRCLACLGLLCSEHRPSVAVVNPGPEGRAGGQRGGGAGLA